MSKNQEKDTLKKIRLAIKNGNYEDAIKMCSQFLAYNPNSYIGNLLMGAAYQNTSKADAIFYLKRACKNSTDPPIVALQGLANCVDDEDLPDILGQLLDLVPEKQLDYLEKLYAISTKNPKIAPDCFSLLKQKLESSPTTEKKHQCKEEKLTNDITDNLKITETMTKPKADRKFLLIYLGKIWFHYEFDQQTSGNNLYKEVLETILSESSPSSDMYIGSKKRYLKLLYNRREYKSCVRNAIELIESLPNDSYAYEWLLKIYCENFQHPEVFYPNNIDNFCVESYISKFKEICPQSILLTFYEATNFYNTQQYAQARTLLYKVIASDAEYNAAIELLAKCETEMESYTLAKDLWKKLGDKFLIDYIICLTHSTEESDLINALELLHEKQEINIDIDEKPPPSDVVIEALSRCYYKLGDRANLDTLSPLMNILCKAEFVLSPEEALETLLSQNENSLDINSYPVQMLIGKLYFNCKAYSSALVYMLKATRLKPFSSECFYFLGVIYYIIDDDALRARKCWEKCINLNPVNMEAIRRLSCVYQQINEEDMNFHLLQNALKYLNNSTNSIEINYRMGLHYTNINKWNEAIRLFRMVINDNPINTVYWECLGDAYAERGSYNSAMKVFQKILIMQPSNVYAKFQIATMKATMRMYAEAIDVYNELLERHPDYVPALKGVAEAHLGLMNNLKQDYRYGAAREHLQLAINMLQRCFLNKENLQMVWLWRLTASIFLLTARMPNSLANLDVAGYLVKRDTEIAFLNRTDLFNLASRFYTCALKIKQNTYLWYELAVCYYYMADYNNDDVTNTLDMAMSACQMAIQEQSNRWQNWSLLGVINAHKHINNLPMAQHCLIQALNLDRKSYIAWTNLGALYLKLNEITLANRAFQRAQQALPIYANAWIGQAFIAEKINEIEEALDLFRHCQQFDYHPEAALGYAHWVCLILSDQRKRQLPRYAHAINGMYADAIGLDAINRYVVNEEMNSGPAAFSFQGFLCEEQKLYRPAIKAYTNAALTATNPRDRDLMFTNLGFVYLKLNEPNEAISVFNKVTEAALKPIIGLALAYFRAGQHLESYSIYNTVLKNISGTDSDQASIILVAMASMVYAFQGEADTKTILYQCILLKDSPIEAQLSACALGILHSDDELTKTILNELKKYENIHENASHIAYLTSLYYLITEDPRKAYLYILKRVHCFPYCANLRKILANFLLKNHKRELTYKMAINQVALSAIYLTQSNEKKNNNYAEDAESLLTASCALEMVSRYSALKLVQRAIHLNPNNKKAWKALWEIY